MWGGVNGASSSSMLGLLVVHEICTMTRWLCLLLVVGGCATPRPYVSCVGIAKAHPTFLGLSTEDVEATNAYHASWDCVRKDDFIGCYRCAKDPSP